MTDRRLDITGTVLAVLSLAGLIGASFWILRPFLGAILWATMIVVATWPVMLAVERRVFGRRDLAVTVMTLGLLLVLVLPLVLAITALTNNATTLTDWAQTLSSFPLPPPPAWLARLPLIGNRVASSWQHFVSLDTQELVAMMAPYTKDVVAWLLGHVGSLGLVLVEFVLTVAIAAIMYATGEQGAQGVMHFARRLAGDRGADSARLAAQAIRSIALGVVGTALIQSALVAVGLAIAGIPFVALLTAAAFILTVAQVGPLLVLGPAVIWLFATGSSGLGTFLLVWTIFVTTADNFIRPWLIKRGADLPLLLIFAGVVGGLIAFGVIGIFVGPVILAVSWTLLAAWVGDDRARSPNTMSDP